MGHYWYTPAAIFVAVLVPWLLGIGTGIVIEKMRRARKRRLANRRNPNAC